MTASQVSACHSCYQIPWALTAIGVGYNVSGAGAKLRVTGPVLAGIYLGQITRWNDPKIQSLNPRLKLPSLKITPIYANGSGDTYVFTNYLSDVSSSWRKRAGIGTTVGFPTGVAANSNPAITAQLESTNGAIAYVGVSYLIAHALPAAAIQNADGNYEYPNLSNIESAARAVKHMPSNDVVRIVDPPSSARSAYPISTPTYAIVPANSNEKPALKQWILYAMGAGQAFGPALDFAPLPPVIRRAATATVRAFSR
jgi:phosphate transport system substrate-binding protein